MKSFLELSRMQRLRRFKELAQASLSAYGMTGAQLKFVQYNENVIFCVNSPSPITSVDSRFVPHRYALRIHAIDDETAVASELAWLAALDREAGLPVPAPVSTTDGGLFASIVTPAFPDGRLISMLRWLNGRKIQKGLRPAHLTAFGRVVAQLHDFSVSWETPPGFERFVWDWDSQLGGSMFERSLEELIESMPDHFREPFKSVSNDTKQAMESLGKASDVFGLIHADLYPENVLYKEGHACPIDFEDCGYGYWMWDIAVALCEWAWKEDWERMRDSFYDGYARFRTLPETQWKLLDLFVAAQFATMLLWASAFLKRDQARAAEYEPWRNESGEKLLRYFTR